MAELKTKPTKISVETFIKKIEDAKKRADSLKILELMKSSTKAEPKMWGTSIIGFCDVHLKYESGRELDWFKIGFSPRKQHLVLYLCNAIQKQAPLLKKLGKHKTGVGCLYLNKLEDVDMNILQQLIECSCEKNKNK